MNAGSYVLKRSVVERIPPGRAVSFGRDVFLSFVGKALYGYLIEGFCFFFFNDTATTEIYTLSLHDALPISPFWNACQHPPPRSPQATAITGRSEEHTSELQSRQYLVCRLLLENKKKILDQGIDRVVGTQRDEQKGGGMGG